ncbi:MAG: DEAD/DEAH box helicase, partial [SAR324 cluster bacterium]|nr:DEAD/DEAH box helicase [SAR324 cluster bacterium]
MEAITVGVRELVAEEPVAGSLMGGGQAIERARLGSEAHRETQTSARENDPDYRAEVMLSHTFPMRGYAVTVRGRVDGVLERGDAPVVEEIKSSFAPRAAAGRAGADPEHPHRLQLVFYQLLYFLERDLRPLGRLVYVGLTDGAREELYLEFDESTARRMLDLRLNAYLHRLEAWRKEAAEKQRQATGLTFPFPQRRPGQGEMVAAVEEALEAGESLLISAPTGIGKTVAALYPAVKHALAHGGTVFFLTAKTTQQAIALETLRRMGGDDPPRAAAVRAREKLCANDRVVCHPAHCAYARDYYSKMAQGRVLEELAERRVVGSEVFFDVGKSHEVCPFELSLDYAGQADAVICDYNYVFDPRVRLRRLVNEGSARRALLIVDEAHNLADRVRGAYSPLLGERQLGELIQNHENRAHPLDRRILEAALGLQSLLLRHREDRPAGEPAEWELVPLREELLACGAEWEALLHEHMLEGMTGGQGAPGRPPDEPFPRFARQIVFFLDLLAREKEDTTYFYRAEGAETGLQTVCLDPAPRIRDMWRRFHSVVAMSATLEPAEYYRGLFGLDADTPHLTLPSPFPAANRRVIVAPQVDTRYKARQANYAPIARLVVDLAARQPGNLLVFFPSFAFLKAVWGQMTFGPDGTIGGKIVLRQESRMAEPEREALLERLRDATAEHLLLGVQGGIFAEGVDYPGTMAQGVIVIGPGLPMVEPTRERLAAYYEEHLGSGFTHAYIYPGMQRVVQAAGRVIRSGQDRGVIVLLGRRFAQAP